MTPGIVCSCCSVTVPFKSPLLRSAKTSLSLRDFSKGDNGHFFCDLGPKLKLNHIYLQGPRREGARDVPQHVLLSLHNVLIYVHLILPLVPRGWKPHGLWLLPGIPVHLGLPRWTPHQMKSGVSPGHIMLKNSGAG